MRRRRRRASIRLKTLRERYRGVERRKGRMLDRIGKLLQHLDGTHLEPNLAGDSSKDKVCLLHPPTLEDELRREEMEGEGEERKRRSEQGGRRSELGGRRKKRRGERRKRRRLRRRRRGIQQCHQTEEERK